MLVVTLCIPVPGSSPPSRSIVVLIVLRPCLPTIILVLDRVRFPVTVKLTFRAELAISVAPSDRLTPTVTICPKGRQEGRSCGVPRSLRYLDDPQKSPLVVPSYVSSDAEDPR